MTPDCKIIYISHRLGEVSQCADRVIALRDGENAGELSRDQISHDSMVNLMVGRALERNTHAGSKIKDDIKGLEVTNLRTLAYPNCKVTFRVAAGEILGMAGLVGAGRSELAQAIFGVDQALEGEVKINSVKVNNVH